MLTTQPGGGDRNLARKVPEASTPRPQASVILDRGQRGQSLILVIFAFMGLLAFVGLGVDLGLFYVERVEIGRAVDAAALASVSELPVEQAAHERAFTYLQDNGYDYEAGSTVWRTGTYNNDGTYSWDPGLPPTVTTVIWVDTAYSQDGEASDPSLSATRIRVRVRQKLPTIFMQFFGFRHLPVESYAEAESIDHVDSVLVYDDSGSMEFNTMCYGCWERDPDEMYPKGNIFPLHWSDGAANADHCAADCGESDFSDYQDGPTDGDGDYIYEHNSCAYRHRESGNREYYAIIEAEEYSSITPEYQPIAGQPFHTFWVIQRNDKDAFYHRADKGDRGSYLRHHPYASLTSHFDGIAVPCTLADIQADGMCAHEVPDSVPSNYLIPGREEEIENILPQPAPRADYHFSVPTSTTYYFWARGQGGDDSTNTELFWSLDDFAVDSVQFGEGAFYDGANSYDWEWRCLGRATLGKDESTHAHTLKLWAGGPGVAVDRIMITSDGNDSYCSGYTGDGLPFEPAGFASNQGRTDWACHPCDPRFAGRPGGQAATGATQYRPDCAIDNRYDPIYDDEQPIRDALESAKYFVSRMDIRLDQVGYVAYDNDASIEDELECIRRRGPKSLGAPGCDPDQESISDPCGCYQRVMTNTILSHLDTARANGSTNIAHAMRLGISVLKTVPDDYDNDGDTDQHYGRPGAAHVMILMTDGQANTHDHCAAECDDDPDFYPHDDDPDNDCVGYYAREARDNGIVVYTIGLGTGADKDLLRYVADLTGGRYYPATRDNLDDIFDELYERIFIRLVK